MREATELANDVPMALLLVGSVNRLELSEQNEPMSKLKSLDELFGGRHFDREIIIEYSELLATL